MKRSLGDVVQLVQEAPFSQTGWETALRALATATRSSSGQIIGIGAARVVVFNLMTTLVEPEICRRWDTEIGAYSSSNWRVAATGGVLELRHEHHYQQVRNPGRSALYDDFCHDANMPFGCQTVLLNQGGLLIGLATLRSYDDGPTSEEDRTIFSDIAPHVLAAARMQRSLENEAARLVAGSLDALSAAAFLCDRRGRVGAMTAAAETMISEGGLIALRDGELCASQMAENRELRAMIDQMLTSNDSAPAPRSLWLGMNKPIARRRLCEAFRLPRREFSFGFDPHLLVTVRTASDISAAERDAIRKLLGLTTAEAEIAMMMAEGLPRETIAVRRGTSTGTVSVQIKRLFEKTSTAREAELVALVRRMLR